MEPIENIAGAEGGSRLMFLKNPSSVNSINEPAENIKVLELLNMDVELPPYDDTLYWCKIFKINDFMERSQLIKARKVCHYACLSYLTLNTDV